MKKIYYLLASSFILVFSIGCETGIPPGVEDCEWNTKEQVTFYDMRLHFPPGLSYFHEFLIPSDKIERSLMAILETDGDASPLSYSSIFINIKPDINDCIGDKPLTYFKGAPEVGINTIEVPFVSNASFNGELTVVIKSDSFINTVGAGAYYQVRWSGSSNNPNGGFVGDIYGTKVLIGNPDGSPVSKVISKDGCYYQNGQKICM